MKVINPRDVSRVMEVVDQLGIHRESVRVPLAPTSRGGVRIEGRTLVIELPEVDISSFLAHLAEDARRLPEFGALRRADS